MAIELKHVLAMTPLRQKTTTCQSSLTNIVECNFPKRYYTFRNLLGLLESAIMLQTSTLEINV